MAMAEAVYDWRSEGIVEATARASNQVKMLLLKSLFAPMRLP